MTAATHKQQNELDGVRSGGIGLCAALIVTAFFLASCEPKIATRGHLPRADELARVTPGVDNKQRVRRLLGSPASIATFDDNVWYYIGRTVRKRAFLSPEITDHRVVALSFDGDGILREIAELDENDLRPVSPSERTTPTSGRELSILEQFFGNLNRFRN